MEDKLNLIELLEYIDPVMLTYQEWVNVGMALKHEGYTASDWDNWSRRDSERYHSGECFKKWTTFDESSSDLVTGATITKLAKDGGWRSSYKFDGEGYELGWDDTIIDDLVIVDSAWVEGIEINEPKNFNPVNEITTYLRLLFNPDEHVGYNVEAWQGDDGKWKPSNQGSYSRTAGELIRQLNACNGDIGAVLGDYNEEAGAWIRFNPLDGQGVKNQNVSEYRYALVESDNTSIEKQNAIIRELELPVVVMVHSGGKSLHAIVKIDAKNYDEYRTRVDYLYQVCDKNGLKIDKQNRNPSRLSRLPGVLRNGKKQFIVDQNIGKENWEEWKEWIEGVNDDLPDPESLADYFDNPPKLAPELIKGVLRQGHKMLIAGPSKAGKSFALIEMTIAIAEGKEWLGWECTQGKVLYVNLELDKPSAYRRFIDVYKTLGIPPQNVGNIDIWNLRGKSVPMDKLAPKLIRRASKKNYIAIIIDPIYKVLTGDENSAEQMGKFTNQFDKVASELGCAVIYCHHHSKGSQGGKKSMDRASGSGVFARDPDALIDLIELELTEDIFKQIANKRACKLIEQYIKKHNLNYYDSIDDDDFYSRTKMEQHAATCIRKEPRSKLTEELQEIDKQVRLQTAWRVEGTLREFPKFKAKDMWFEYPVHRIDDTGILQDIKLDDANPFTQGRKKLNQNRSEKANAEFEEAFNMCDMDGDGQVTLQDIMDYTGKSKQSIYGRIKKMEKFIINDGVIEKVKK